MEFEEIVQKFIDKQSYLTNGAGLLSKIWNVSKDTVKAAKKEAKLRLKFFDAIDEHIELNTHKANLPKILIFDLETSPLKAWVWGKWDQNISSDQLISDWFLLSWSAKWLYSSEVFSGVLEPEEVFAENDERIINPLWDLVDQADILIAHNGNRFDVPRLNSRFIVNGLMPPSSYKTIDTLQVARSQFGFSSNKLDDLASIFKLGKKLHTGFELWRKCMAGDKESLKYMEKYNKKDVVLLEEVYLQLRPYIKSHPNAAVYVDSLEPMCSMCGSTYLKEEKNLYYTNTGAFKQYRCSCGALSRGRKNILSKEKKQDMLTAIPR